MALFPVIAICIGFPDPTVTHKEKRTQIPYRHQRYAESVWDLVFPFFKPYLAAVPVAVCIRNWMRAILLFLPEGTHTDGGSVLLSTSM